LRKGVKAVPVTYVDLDPQSEKLALATFDPITYMAQADAAALDALLASVNTGEAAVQEMLAQLAQDAGIVPPDFAPVDVSEQPRLDQKAPVTCPHCGAEFVPK